MHERASNPNHSRLELANSSNCTGPAKSEHAEKLFCLCIGMKQCDRNN